MNPESDDAATVTGGSMAVGTCGNEVKMLGNDGAVLWRAATAGWVVGSAVRGFDCDVFFCSLDRHAYRVGRCAPEKHREL